MHAVFVENERHRDEHAQAIHKDKAEQRDGTDEEHARKRIVRVGEREIPHAAPMIYVREREEYDEQLDLAFAHVVVAFERFELFVLDVKDEHKRDGYRNDRVEIEVALEIQVLCVPDDAPHEYDQVGDDHCGEDRVECKHEETILEPWFLFFTTTTAAVAV